MRRVKSLLITFFLTASAAVGGEPLRVATWNIGWRGDVYTGATEAMAEEAAVLLRHTNPDIILLQGVPDAEFCESLLGNLEPLEFQVTVCSAFDAPETGPDPGQVAILARWPSKAAGAHLWPIGELNHSGRGFAFARYGLMDRTLVFCSIAMEGNETGDVDPALDNQLNILARELSGEYLGRFLNHLREQAASPIAGIILGGLWNTDPRHILFVSENTIPQLRDMGFQSVRDRGSTEEGGNGIDPGFDDLYFADIRALSEPSMAMISSFEHVLLAQDFLMEAAPLEELNPITSIPSPANLNDPANTDTEVAAATGEVETLPERAEAKERVRQVPGEARPAPTAPNVETETSWWSMPIFAWGSMAGGAGMLLAMGGGYWWRRRRRSRQIHGALPVPWHAAHGSAGLVTCPKCNTSLILSGLPDGGGMEVGDPDWRDRAIRAEVRAAQATTIVRQGLIPYVAHWMKEKFIYRLLSHRQQMEKTQQLSTDQVLAMQERVAQVNADLSSQLDHYRNRIAELEKDVRHKENLNRVLLQYKRYAKRAARKVGDSRPQSSPKSHPQSRPPDNHERGRTRGAGSP